MSSISCIREKKKYIFKKAVKAAYVFLLLLSLLVLFSCEKKNESKKEIKSIFELNDEKYTIGVGVGSHAQVLAENELSKAKILYYNSESLGYNAIKAGQIDAFVFDRVPMQLAINSGLSGLKLVSDNLEEITQVAIGLPKHPRIHNLKEKINQYIKELKNDGTLDDMYNRWVYQGIEDMPHIEEVQNPTRELIVGTTGLVPPYTFFIGDQISGYDVELSYRLAKKFNAKLTFKIYDYDGIVAALVTNDIDFACANLNITKERAESIDYSDVLYENYVTAMIKDHNENEHFLSNFIENIKSGFEKTFIRENRYELFIDGIFCTLRITIFAIVLGTILGFVLFLICYNAGDLVNNSIKIIFWLLRRIPIIVLLMVFYYIIFSKLSMNSELVAVIAFTIIFGSLVAELMINTIKNLDIGQSEAAYALGFDRQSTFFKILFPQAFPIMFPNYTNMIVELIRSTAIVGYVAVQDLTKVGDLVRSRTYDAFFPLIAVAIIYVILAELLIFVIYRIKNAKGLGKESKYLKGVKRND